MENNSSVDGNNSTERKTLNNPNWKNRYRSNFSMGIELFAIILNRWDMLEESLVAADVGDYKQAPKVIALLRILYLRILPLRPYQIEDLKIKYAQVNVDYNTHISYYQNTSSINSKYYAQLMSSLWSLYELLLECYQRANIGFDISTADNRQGGMSKDFVSGR